MKPNITYKNIDKQFTQKEKILQALKDKPLCVSDVEKLLDSNQPRASSLLKEMYIDGFLERKKVNTFVFYGLKKIKR